MRWRVEKYEAGAFDEDARAADLVQAYEARIVALDRLVGKQALELEFLKGAARSAPLLRSGPTSADRRPYGLPGTEGCRLRGVAHSTYYDTSPVAALDDTVLVKAIAAICDEFEVSGWRRVRATLRQQRR